jgi:hypothetical protein
LRQVLTNNIACHAANVLASVAHVSKALEIHGLRP